MKSAGYLCTVNSTWHLEIFESDKNVAFTCLTRVNLALAAIIEGFHTLLRFVESRWTFNFLKENATLTFNKVHALAIDLRLYPSLHFPRIFSGRLITFFLFHDCYTAVLTEEH